MYKGYRLASPGAVAAIVCFFLPWFVLSGCEGSTTVRGVDAVKLMGDSNMSVGQKVMYSGPAIAVFLMALLILALAVLAWKRGQLRRWDSIGVTGLSVLFTIALGWYLFILREAIVQVRYGFWGEVLAGLLLLMGGMINWRLSGRGEVEESTAVPSSPATWKWGMTAVILTALFAFGTGLVFPSEENGFTTVSPSSSSPNLVNNSPAAVPTATPAPQQYTIEVNTLTPTDIFIREGQYVWIQAEGNIKVGPFVGYVDPDGKNDSFLASYSIAHDIPHGALLCRFRGGEWTYCGSEVAFQSDGDGYLEFEINDNDQGNNSDAFDVQVIVSSYSVQEQQEQDTVLEAETPQDTDDPRAYLQNDLSCLQMGDSFMLNGTILNQSERSIEVVFTLKVYKDGNSFGSSADSVTLSAGEDSFVSVSGGEIPNPYDNAPPDDPNTSEYEPEMWVEAYGIPQYSCDFTLTTAWSENP